MIRNLLLAAAFSSLSTLAFAQSNPHFVGEGNNPHVEYDAPTPNIVGSALATVSGSPGQTEYRTLRVFRTQSPSPDYPYGVNQPWQIPVDSSN